MKTMGAFEVKTHLSQILKEIQITGESIAITKHGITVALLSPATQTNSITAAIETIQKNRQGITLGKLTLKQLIAEGRR